MIKRGLTVVVLLLLAGAAFGAERASSEAPALSANLWTYFERHLSDADCSWRRAAVSGFVLRTPSGAIPETRIAVAANEFTGCTDSTIRSTVWGTLPAETFWVRGDSGQAQLKASGMLLNEETNQLVRVEVSVTFTATDPARDGVRDGIAVGSVVIDGVEYAVGPSTSAFAARHGGGW